MLLVWVVIPLSSWSQPLAIGPETYQVVAFDITPDKEHAVVAFDGGVGLLGIRNNHWISEVKHNSMTNINVLALSSDSSRVYYGTTTGKLGQLTTGNSQQKDLMHGDHGITCLKAIPDDLLVIGDKNGKLTLWDTQKEQSVVQHELEAAISAVAYNTTEKQVLILTIDGKIWTMTHIGAIDKILDIGKTAFDMSYISENKKLHIATKNALHTYRKTDNGLTPVDKRKNNLWNICTTDSDRLQSPAVAYMNGLIKAYSPFAVFKYKLSSAPLAIAYVLADRSNINLLVLGMDLKLYLIRTDQWKMKT